MSKVTQAAHDLMVWLRDNLPPGDAEGQEDEWPVSILTDNAEDADKLAELFEELEDALADAGHPVR